MKKHFLNFKVKLFSFSCCMLFLTNCTATPPKNNDASVAVQTANTIQIPIDVNKSQSLCLFDSLYIADYIPLETTDEALIREISQIYTTDSHILIFDEQGNGIFLYDNTGKFLRKIGRNGQGPGEYGALSDVFLESSTGLVHAIDHSRNVVLIYNLNGDLVKELSSKTIVRSFCKTKSGYWVYSPYKGVLDGEDINPEGYNLVLLNERLNQTIAGFLPQKEFFPVPVQPAFVHDEQGNMFFIHSNSNIVYRLDDETQSPTAHFIVDFGEKTLPYAKMAKITEREDYDAVFDEKQYLNDISNFHFCNNTFYFSFSESNPGSRTGRKYSACFDLGTSEVQVYSGHAVNISSSDPNPFKALSLTELVGVYQDKLIYAINPSDMKDVELDMVRKTKSQSVTEESNPVLFFLAPKKTKNK